MKTNKIVCPATYKRAEVLGIHNIIKM